MAYHVGKAGDGEVFRPGHAGRGIGGRVGDCRHDEGCRVIGRSRSTRHGYRAALDTAGIPVDPTLIREGDFQVEDGLRHTHDLLRLPDPPTAIFACNDGQAIGVYQAANPAGKRIPHDLSVIGFDDLLPAPWMIPPLTTISQPLTEMAAAAATMVVALARDEPPSRTRLELATDLVLRASTAPPRQKMTSTARGCEAEVSRPPRH